jgi:hypothetical protein
MRDPVLLPGVGERTCVDRSTLPTLGGVDPVTEERFRIEDVEDNGELKRKIQEWIAHWTQTHRP